MDDITPLNTVNRKIETLGGACSGRQALWQGGDVAFESDVTLLPFAWELVGQPPLGS